MAPKISQREVFFSPLAVLVGRVYTAGASLVHTVVLAVFQGSLIKKKMYCSQLI